MKPDTTRIYGNVEGCVVFCCRRLLFAGFLVFLVSSGSLLLTHLAPGDYTTDLFRPGVTPETLAEERNKLGLDRPFLSQYWDWLSGFLNLDLGTSFRFQQPVVSLVAQRAANTAWLAGTALLLATVVGLPLGVVAGARDRSFVASVIRFTSVVCLSLPPLLTSLLLALFAARTGWFPIGGMGSPAAIGLTGFAPLVDLAWHLVLPALALALPIGATLERLLARSMSETLREPFIFAALARGIPRSRVVWKHALRVAIRPVAGIYGLIIGSLLSGSFAVELVTAWPGLGHLTFQAVISRDLYLVAGCGAGGALFLAGGNLVSDVALALADPRIRDR